MGLFNLGGKQLKSKLTIVFTPIFDAQALLIIGVSSLHNSTNFLRSFSLEGPDLAYAGKNNEHEETLPVNHSPDASLITKGAKLFYISESESALEIAVSDLVA